MGDDLITDRLRAILARQVEAAIAMFHASSSASSSCLHIASSNNGTRLCNPCCTNRCDVRSGSVCASRASSISSLISSSSSQTVVQNSTACCPTSSSSCSNVALWIEPHVNWYKASMYCGSLS